MGDTRGTGFYGVPWPLQGAMEARWEASSFPAVCCWSGASLSFEKQSQARCARGPGQTPFEVPLMWVAGQGPQVWRAVPKQNKTRKRIALRDGPGASCVPRARDCRALRQPKSLARTLQSTEPKSTSYVQLGYPNREKDTPTVEVAAAQGGDGAPLVRLPSRQRAM